MTSCKTCSMVLVLLLCSTTGRARDYRVDSQERFDAVRNLELLPGDAILLKRGKQFSGMLSLSGKGSEEAPIRVAAYGNGNRPQIHVGGQAVAGLLLRNPSYWEVQGLEITNTDGTDRDQGELFGIYVLAEGAEGIYQHVVIDDCYVHDVNGNVAGKRRGGIHVHVRNLKSTRFHNLRITRNRVVNVGGVGIGNSSSCGRIEFLENATRGHHLWTGVYVADNYIDRTGRNSIIARVSKDGVYERNTLANSSRYDTGHSIFCFSTDGIRIQYNEAYGNTGPGGIDRGGFDADFNCVNTLIQYNYSHDNDWFCGIMKRRQRNAVIRYNVSQNDRRGIYFYGFEPEQLAEDIHIYNNTHFVGKDLEVEVFPAGRTPLNTVFENNIFFFEGEGHWGTNAPGINTTFRNNLYFNIEPHPSEEQPLEGDPEFVDPGKAGTNIDLTTMNALRVYQLRAGSPFRNAAIPREQHGGYDLLKRPVTNGEHAPGACGTSETLTESPVRPDRRRRAE